MNPKKYRREYQAQIAAAAAAAGPVPARRGVRALTTIINNSAQSVEDRIAAIDEVTPLAFDKPSAMAALLGVLGDPAQDDDVRRAALAALQQCTFRTVDFRPYQVDFVAALRSAATDDDAVLRERALDILALNGDDYVQQLLMDGLRDPSAAMVSPQQAVRMIGYDVHAEHYELLRDIVQTSKKAPLRHAALRLLAADSGAKEMFAGIVADRGEDAIARSTSAIALQSLAPEEFGRLAGALVADPDDDDRVRAALLNALAHGGAADPDAVATAARSIGEAAGGSAQLKRAARTYLGGAGQ